MPMFIDLSGEGVYVNAKPHRRRGRKPNLTRAQRVAASAGIWSQMQERGCSYRDIASVTGFHFTTIWEAVRKVRAAAEGAREHLKGEGVNCAA